MKKKADKPVIGFCPLCGNTTAKGADIGTTCGRIRKGKASCNGTLIRKLPWPERMVDD